MGSIALPALSIRPPQQPDLGGNIERLLALKSMLGQQQLQSVQIEQAKQQLQDRQTLQDIAPKYVKKNDQGQPTGFDYDSFSAEAQSKGVSPATMTQLATMQKTNADTLKARADAGQATVQTQEKLLGDAYNHIEGIRGETDPQKRQTNWQAATNWAQQNKIEGAQSLPQQAPDDKALDLIEAQLGMHAQTVADVKAQSEIRKTQAETTEATEKGKESAATAQAKQAEALWYQQHPNAGAPGIPAENVSAADWLAKNPGKTFSDYTVAMKKIVPAYNFQLESGGAPQPALNPQQQATAQAILEGRMDPPGSFALKTPYWQNVMGEVFRQDPQWNEQRHELRKDFTVGKHSNEINAINTALQHTGVLGDSIDALKNNNVQVLNRIANSIGVQVGATPKTTFDTIVGRLGPELAKAYSVGTGGERGEIEKGLSAGMSPDQLKTNISTNVQLLEGKINSLRNQWDQNKGQTMPSFDDRFMTDQAKTTMQKWAPKAGGGNQPSGATHTGIGSVDKKLHWLDANGKDLGVAQ